MKKCSLIEFKPSVLMLKFPLSVKLVRVIKEVSAVGAGTKEDPVRERTQYWGLDGTLLFAIDSANLENEDKSMASHTSW